MGSMKLTLYKHRGDSEARPGWASFGKGWKHIASQDTIAWSHLDTADISQNTTFANGYEFIDSETFCFLAIDKPNK